MVNAGRILIIAKGAWNSLASYQQLDVVSYDKTAYLARQASVGVNPSTDTSMTYWQPFGSSVEPDGETIITDNDGNLAVNIDGHSLVYDVENEVLKAVLSLSNLTNVAITDLTNGQFLTYDENENKWKNITLNLKTKLESLTDVNISDPVAGQVLGYNPNNEKWVNVNQSGGLLPHLIIISDTGSTVTVTKGTTAIAAPETSTGHFECDIPEFGTWTIDSILSGDDAQMSLVVDTVKVYTVDDSHFHASITVTFPSGATCRCQGGSENYYATTTPYTFTVHSANTYTITATDGTATDTETVNITTSGQTASVTLSFIPNGTTVTPVGNIQTWLHCADIWNKSYTTIAQVLNDASTLQALIASNNASDYMARSTTWASDVTADSTAMTYIGANDYCADTLLADSTWLNAICDSTYFESVLNVKVPTMTSNTTPSGVASASSVFSGTGNEYAPYKAFDKNTSTRWLSTTVSASTVSYIQYMFTNPVVINKVSVQFDTWITGSISTISKLKIKGSNDGSNFTDVAVLSLSAKKQDFVIQNNIAYNYIRLEITGYNAISTSQSVPSNVSIDELQFYGRATS